MRALLTRHRLAKSGNNIARIRVLLSRGLDTCRQRELCGAMSKETQRLPYRLDWDNLATDALELARLMPPGRNATRHLNWQANFVAPLMRGD